MKTETYRSPIAYSPENMKKQAVIYTEMQETRLKPRMWVYLLEMDKYSTFTFSLTRGTENGYWMRFDDYEEAERFIFDSNYASFRGTIEELKDVPLIKLLGDLLDDMIDLLRMSEERYINSVYDKQRLIYEKCAKKINVTALTKNVTAIIANFRVDITEVKNGYQFHCSDSPDTVIDADNMLDAINYLPEYLSLPRLIYPENVRFIKLTDINPDEIKLLATDYKDLLARRGSDYLEATKTVKDYMQKYHCNSKDELSELLWNKWDTQNNNYEIVDYAEEQRVMSMIDLTDCIEDLIYTVNEESGEKYSKILCKRYIENLTFDQLSKELNVSPQTLNIQIEKTLEKLAKYDIQRGIIRG